MKSYLKFLSRNKLYTVIEAVGLAGHDDEKGGLCVGLVER